MPKVSKVVKLQAAQKLAADAEKIEQAIVATKAELQRLQDRLTGLQEAAEKAWCAAGRALLSPDSAPAPATKLEPEPASATALPEGVPPGTVIAYAYQILKAEQLLSAGEMAERLLAAHPHLVKRYGTRIKLRPLVRQTFARQPQLFQKVASSNPDQPIRWRLCDQTVER